MKTCEPLGEASYLLVIRLGAIGDVVLATASLQLLQESHPDKKLLFLGTEPSLGLIRSFFQDIEVFDYNNLGGLESFKTVETVFDLQVNQKSLRFCRLLRKYQSFKLVRCNKLYLKRYKLLLKSYLRGRFFAKPQGQDLSFQFNIMMEAIGQNLARDRDSFSHYRPKLIEKKKETKHFLEVGPRYIGLALGASFESKRAPFELVSHVINEIHKKDSFKSLTWVLLGDKNDQKLVESLYSYLKNSPTMIDYTGKLSLVEMPYLLKQLSVVLTNDSGLLHMSEAVGTPVAALFGPTVEDFGFRPHLPRSQSFSVNLGCRPCSKHGNLSCRYNDWACFHKIDPLEVANFLWGHVS